MAKPRPYVVKGHDLVPVCRIHVYGTPSIPELARNYAAAARPPVHWCGRDPELRGTDQPHAILGKDAFQLKDAFGNNLPDPKRSKWQVLSARVNLVRQWNTASANFQLAHPLLDYEHVEVPPIELNDIVVIEMGYLQHLNQTMAKSYNPKTREECQTDYNRFMGDVVFCGVVDTITERGGSGDHDGVVWTVKCRDHMRWLADNKIVATYRPAISKELNRAFVIRDLCYLGAQIDTVQWETGYNERGVFERQPKLNAAGEILPAKRGPDNSYIRLGNIEVSSRADQLPVELGTQNRGMWILDKHPLQVIKHFSLVETTPREMWADHRTGQIHWTMRRTDATRLFSPDPEISASRQFFYRFPADRANILSYTNEESIAGTVTHFTITSPQAVQGNTGTKNLYAESPMALLKNPRTGAYLRPMTRNRFVFDDTGTTEESTKGVAGALFHTWGRTLDTGMVMVLGDPGLEIGEAVQLFNTGLGGRRSLRGQKNHYDGDANSVTPGGSYTDVEYNPEGIHRVESIQHLFAVGGVKHGYTTVFAFGPVDEDTGDPPRLIKDEAGLNQVFAVDANGKFVNFIDVGLYINETETLES